MVLFGRKPAAFAYLLNGYMGMAVLTAFWMLVALTRALPLWTLLVPVIYLVLHTSTWHKLTHHDGAALNPLLGETARNMLIFTLLLTIILIIYSR